ncbi:MAG: prephenate dehydrogenase/arogenate dehydrogenase family protein [Acidimicrobiia bacterium]|nr:prephenate dehydrogenase/arogenate dehydrogenase family protein [Acidimicrobiia bacterium]
MTDDGGEDALSDAHNRTAGDGGRRANVIGLGLIGGSIGLALRARGWFVLGEDVESQHVRRAIELGAIDGEGLAADADITFVAVPVLSSPEQVDRALAATAGPVTDVGSVKGPVSRRCDHPRFVGGHPMAGSELDGLDGADGDLFSGAVWVLTPVEHSDDTTFALVTNVVASLGAEVVALTPERHDQVVATVSHVPHLTAATLMGLATDRSNEHASLLRLAAGGFRDMTRVASGQPAIWLDICSENRPAIVSELDRLIQGLGEVREMIDSENLAALEIRLHEARNARANLPSRAVHPEEIAEVRIPIPDRSGAAAEVFTLAAELSVNIFNFEVVHVAESNRGVAVVLVDQALVELFRGGLIARGFRPAVQALS